MSLSFVESLIDKLFPSSRGNETSLMAKFTGSQNLIGHNHGVYQSIPPEFHQLILETDYLSTVYSEAQISITPGAKRTKYQHFESSTHGLLSRVPKLFSPAISTFLKDSFHRLPKQTEMLFDAGLYMDSYCDVDHRNQSDVHTKDKMVSEGTVFHTDEFKPKYDQKVKVDPVSMSIGITVICKEPLAQHQIINPVMHPPVLKTQKCIMESSCILNQELTMRKTKELQKRSKKRRRRQKSKKKSCATKNLKSVGGIVFPSRGDEDCNVICDIVTIRERTNSVEIVLPDLSSFVISVESAEDDSEWDDDHSSEWLVNDCAEFELSGLFVTNLTGCSIGTQSKTGLITQLKVPTCNDDDDQELYKINSALRVVNQTWNEVTRILDKKPKLPTKVSFAPECDLVTVVPVGMYERKGEWEVYATERLRFMRRIDDVENILSPCLSKEHREKIFLKLQQTNL